ncbi:hypothetical protein MPNT_250009 [Candidatus Methylacidithermus pantelleriae]|uniref:Uncharacterized protein n=1 Tax=Candidatus Methylacidithermus pantelleriae TaxID=2744239 RepID=A0A8J2BTK5_9BACT|nr:hypothetical protein MPNT_250009 [Candidatus Methylacidithermus pantelleriae]
MCLEKILAFASPTLPLWRRSIEEWNEWPVSWPRSTRSFPGKRGRGNSKCFPSISGGIVLDPATVVPSGEHAPAIFLRCLEVRVPILFENPGDAARVLEEGKDQETGPEMVIPCLVGRLSAGRRPIAEPRILPTPRTILAADAMHPGPGYSHC